MWMLPVSLCWDLSRCSRANEQCRPFCVPLHMCRNGISCKNISDIVCYKSVRMQSRVKHNTHSREFDGSGLACDVAHEIIKWLWYNKHVLHWFGCGATLFCWHPGEFCWHWLILMYYGVSSWHGGILIHDLWMPGCCEFGPPQECAGSSYTHQ